jgi:hypothetical protein
MCNKITGFLKKLSFHKLPAYVKDYESCSSQENLALDPVISEKLNFSRINSAILLIQKIKKNFKSFEPLEFCLAAPLCQTQVKSTVSPPINHTNKNCKQNSN